MYRCACTLWLWSARDATLTASWRTRPMTASSPPALHCMYINEAFAQQRSHPDHQWLFLQLCLPVSFVFSAIVLSSMNERNAFPTRFITSINTGLDGETVTSSMRRNCHFEHAIQCRRTSSAKQVELLLQRRRVDKTGDKVGLQLDR